MEHRYVDPLSQLRKAIEDQIDLMISVATNQRSIDSAEEEYRTRQAHIRTQLGQLGLEDPNRFRRLWDWYGEWSRNLTGFDGAYQARREFVADLYEPLFDQIERLESKADIGHELPGYETEAETLSDQISLLYQRLLNAKTAEDIQAIGLLCRDIMITLADEYHDPTQHGGTAGGSAVDRLYVVVEYYAAGRSNESLRKLLKATIDYANTVQHRRSGTLKEASLIAEATVAAVRLMTRLVSADPIEQDTETVL